MSDLTHWDAGSALPSFEKKRERERQRLRLRAGEERGRGEEGKKGREREENAEGGRLGDQTPALLR